MIPKKFIFATILLSGIIVISCKEKESEKKARTLVLAEVNPSDTISGRMDAEFARLVSEKSGGALQVNVIYDGALGNDEDVLSSIQKDGNVIQLARVSAFALTNLGGKKSSLLTIPYTFHSKNHFWNFAKSSLAQEILDEPYKNGSGIKGLFFAEEGFRNFFGVEPILGVEDFAGKKLRIPNDPISLGLAEGLNANPMQIGFDELLSALSVGGAEIAEQPIANYLAKSLNKIAPNMILDGHTLGVIEIVISSKSWDSLSSKEQEILKEAGIEAGEFCRKISQEAENEAKLKLEKEGVIFTEVLDKPPWRNACEKIISEAAQTDIELYNKILALEK